jgi:hypothetical protein
MSDAGNSTAVGASAGYGAASAIGSAFFGIYAGAAAVSSSYSTFIGPYAGWRVSGSSYSTFIGYNAGFNSTLGNNNILIGTNVTLASGSTNGINIGGLIFGSGSYNNTGSASSGSANGFIGINQPNPLFNLDVSGSARINGNTQITGSVNVSGSITATSPFATGGIRAESPGGGSFIQLVNNIGFGHPGIQSSGIIHMGSPINGTGGGEILAIRKSVGGANIVHFQSNAGATLSTITGNGSLGLNKTYANATLDVSGSAVITGSLIISGSNPNTSSLSVIGTGSGVFTVDGSSGRLFSVDDSLSGSLFSVNTAAGLPVIEAFSDNTVRIGRYGTRVLYVSQSAVGVGKEASLNGILDISGSAVITGSLNLSGSFNINGTLTATTLVVQTITSSTVFSSGSNRFGNDLANTQVFTGSLSVNGPVIFSRYTGSGAFPGTSVANLAVDSNGNVITVVPGTVTSASYAATASFIAPGTNLGIFQIATGSVTASVDVLTNTFRIISGSSTFLTVNNSGSLGLGVTPSSTWDRVALEIGVAGAAITRDTRDLLLMSNTIRTSGGYVYAANAGASRFELGVSSFRWFTAPSGTGGNAISFSQVMTLDASGSLGIGTITPATNAKLTVMGNLTFGLPGNGTNTSGRFISIEGNTDASGEGSSRIFFTEHNSSTVSMDSYGMSLGYRGGNTAIVGASGNTWNGLSLIGNGEWGMWGHDNDSNGSLIMYGDRVATFVNLSNNNLNNVGNAYFNGNVGVGKVTPTSRLDVSGSVLITGSLDITQDITGSNARFIGTLTAQTLVVQTITSSVDFVTGSTRFGTLLTNTHVFSGSVTMNPGGLFVSGSGQVGIGTTTPNNLTDIVGSTAGDGGLFNGTGAILRVKQNAAWTGNQQWALYVEGYSYLNGFRINANDGIRSLYKTAAGGSLGFATAGNDPITFTQNDAIERMRVAAGGNVGIGTTTPTTLLHVSGTTGGVFEVDGAAAVNAFYVSASGNVGIGTTTPTGAYGRLSVAGGIRILDDNNAKLEIGRYSAGAPNSYIKLGTNSNSLRFTNAGDLADIMELTNSGSLGVGKTSPNARLDVNGNAIITGSITATAGGFDSDLTLKDIVTRDLTQYRIADSVSPIIYTWKDTSKGTLQRFGYGAQELLPLIPEAVYQNGSGSTYAVDYTQVHTVLIDENTKRIQALERELAELKQIINALVNNK